MANLRPELDALQEGKVYSFANTSGLEGYQNQFLKQGNQFVPIVGDASQYGQAQSLGFGARDVLQYGYGIRPQDMAIKGGQTLEQSNQAYNAALNDATTPRSMGEQVISGQEALAQQAAARIPANAGITSPGYQETAQDKLIRENLAKGIPIGLANAPQTQPKFVSNYKGNSIVDFLNSVKVDSSQTNRKKLASEYGVQNYDFSEAKNLELLAKLRGATSPTPATVPLTPTTPASSITNDNLKEPPATKLPTPSGDGSTTGVKGSISQEAQTEMDRVMADIQSRKKIIEATKSENQKMAETSLSEELAAIAGLKGKTQYKATLEEEKLGQIEKQLDENYNELAALKGEKARLLAEQQGKPITMSSIIGAQAQINAVMDSKIFAIAATIDALNGNYARAEKSIQRAVDAKYGVLEEQLAISKAQREALAGTLTKEEQLQKDALDRMDELKKQAIKDAKDKEVAQQNFVYDMMSKYSDAGILPTDSIATVEQKVKTSKIYQQQTRLAGGGGGGVPEENAAAALYSGAIDQAIAAGITDPDIIVNGIQAQADANGIKLSVTQLNAIRNKAIDTISKKKPSTTTPYGPNAPVVTAPTPTNAGEQKSVYNLWGALLPSQPGVPSQTPVSSSTGGASTPAYYSNTPAQLSNDIYSSLFSMK